MTCALVYNGNVVAVYDGQVPPRIQVTDVKYPRMVVDGASPGWSDGSGYAILPAQYDTPPNNSVENGQRSYSIANGIVSITRTWIMQPPQPSLAVQINSLSTPALNGPYLVNPQLYSDIAAQVQASGVFPNGSSSFVVTDANSIPHKFTVSSFLALYSAISYYSTATQKPPTPLTIV